MKQSFGRAPTPQRPPDQMARADDLRGAIGATQSSITLDPDRTVPERLLVKLLIGLSAISFVAFLVNNLALRRFLLELARLVDKFVL